MLPEGEPQQRDELRVRTIEAPQKVSGGVSTIVFSLVRMLAPVQEDAQGIERTAGTHSPGA